MRSTPWYLICCVGCGTTYILGTVHPFSFLLPGRPVSWAVARFDENSPLEDSYGVWSTMDYRTLNPVVTV